MKRRGRPPQISEEVEIQIFDLHCQGMNNQEIACRLGLVRETVRDIVRLGEPRWRYQEDGELEPSPAVIAWHRCRFQARWSKWIEKRRRVQTLRKLGVLAASQVVLADLELSPQDLETIEQESSPVDYK